MVKRIWLVTLLVFLIVAALTGCGGSGGQTDSVRFIAVAADIAPGIGLKGFTPSTYVRPKKYVVCLTHVALCQDLDGTGAWSLFDGSPYILELSTVGSTDEIFAAQHSYPPANTTYNVLETITKYVELTVTVHHCALTGNPSGDADVAIRVYLDDYNSAQRGDVTLVIGGVEKWVKSDLTGLLDHRSDGTPYQTSNIPHLGAGTDHNGYAENVVLVNGQYMSRNTLATPLATGDATGTYTFTYSIDLSQGFGYQDLNSDGYFNPDPGADGTGLWGDQPTYSIFTLAHSS